MDGWVADFEDTEAFALKLENDLRRAVQDTFALEKPETKPVAIWHGDPFIGLRVMRIEHGPIFFGRADKTQEALRLLESGPCVALVGPSGTGKSSLAQAGVLYRLTVNQPGSWNTVVFRPGDAGGDPLVAAGMALAQCQADGFSQIERETVAGLTGDDAVAWLVERVTSCLGTDAGGRNLAIVIDQSEELATACPPDRAELFRHAMAALAGPDAPPETRDRLRIIVSLRDDFVALIGDRLEPLFSSRTVLVSRPTPLELIAMIQEPARIALEVEDVDDALLNRLVADAQGVAGGLPLVALALREMLVTAQRGRQSGDGPLSLTIAHHDAIGGPQGLIERLVREKMRQLRITRAETLHPLFRGLIKLNTAYRPTRKRLKLDNTVTEDVRRLLDAFAEARLITIEQDTAELAHDGLLQAWEELRDWIAENEEDLFDARALDIRARAWDRRSRPDDRLLTRLALVEDSRRVRDALPDAFPQIGLIDEYLDRSERLCRREALISAVLGGDILEVTAQIDAGAKLEVSDARRLPEPAYYWAVMGLQAGQRALEAFNRRKPNSGLASLDEGDKSLPEDLAVDKALANRKAFRRAARGITPMHVAAAIGHGDVVQALRRGDFDADAVSDAGWSAFILAAQNGHLDILDQLLASAEVEASRMNEIGRNALMSAAMNGHLNVVDRLLAIGTIEADRTNSIGGSAFMMAAENGHLDVVDRLLASGQVSVDRTTKYGWSAFMFAASRGHLDIVQRLLGDDRVKVDRTNDGGSSAFMAAAESGHLKIVDRLLASKKVEADRTDSFGASALLLAAENGHLEVVDRLLTDGHAEVDRTTNNGWSAFMVAAKNGHLDIVERLIADGRVEVDRTTDSGWSAFMAAARHGHLGIVDRLLANEEVMADRTNEIGGSAFMMAAENGHLDVIDRLLVSGQVSVDRTTDFGWSAFMAAANKGHLDIVERLLADRRVDIDRTDKDGWSALTGASQNGHLDVVNRLLADGRIEVDRTTDIGTSALMHAAFLGHLAVVERLLAEQHVDARRKSCIGVNALMAATSWGHSTVMRLLIDKVPDMVSSTDSSGHEVIDFAAAPWIVFVEGDDPTDEKFDGSANDRAEALDILLPFVESPEKVATAIRLGGPHLHAAPAERLAKWLQPAVEACLTAFDGETAGLRAILRDIAATEHSAETSAVFDAAWPAGWREALRGSSEGAAAT